MEDKSEIIGELREFKRHTIERLSGIEKEIQLLNQFKWRLAGVFSFLLVCIEMVKLLVK